MIHMISICFQSFEEEFLANTNVHYTHESMSLVRSLEVCSSFHWLQALSCVNWSNLCCCIGEENNFLMLGYFRQRNFCFMSNGGSRKKTKELIFIWMRAQERLCWRELRNAWSVITCRKSWITVVSISFRVRRDHNSMNSSGLASLLNDNRVQDVSRLYSLLSRVEGGIALLKTGFSSYIKVSFWNSSFS